MDSAPFRQEPFDEELYNFEQKTSIHKTLILESNCHPSSQYQINIPYNYATRQLDLGRTLYQIFQQIIPPGHSYQVFYYCTESEYFVFGGMYPFQDFLFIGENFVTQPVITVKINRIHPPLVAEPEVQSKKKRINDRTIKEVLEKVAEWRKISKIKGKTLEESSKQLNLSKKTLDDYLFQIKQGQFYGFDFEAHQDQRIGVLRKFVKENHKKKQEQPIKILQEFMKKPEKICSDAQQAQQYEQSNDSEEEEEQQE